MRKKYELFWILAVMSLIRPGVAMGADEGPPKTAAQLQEEISLLQQDRDNILQQAKAIQREKEKLLRDIVLLKEDTSEGAVQLESLRNENEILKTELEKARAAREKDRELFSEQKEQLEQRIGQAEAHSESLLSTMKEYTPEKIAELVEDRNRLGEENKRMAQRVFEYEKQIEEVRQQLTPLELDREELHRLQAENKELRKNTQYIRKLEKRIESLIEQNKEYREKEAVLKAKFKEAAPGIAKSNRISQKMMRENAEMHYNLGTIFLENKKYREAIKEYEQVLELVPNDPETHYNLGVLYDDYLKDREKAIYHYQKYLAINPKAPDAKKVETYILSLELEHKVR